MKNVKFKLIDMLGSDPVTLKAPSLPRVGETIFLGKEEAEVIYVDHSFQRDVRGGYCFKEYVVIVKWKSGREV